MASNDLCKMLRDAYEKGIAQSAEKEPDNVFSWSTANMMSQDSAKKDYYLHQMVECIRRNKDAHSYLKGLYYTQQIKKLDLNRELADEMIEKYPIKGRFLKLAHSPCFM